MTNKKGLSQLCTKDNYIYSNYYSDRYRANLTIEDENGDWDIERIQIPFDEKHRNIIAAFLPEAYRKDMDQYCSDFAYNIRSALSSAKFLKEKSSKFIMGNMAVKTETDKETGISNLYIITKPYKTASEIFSSSEGIKLSNILMLTVNMVNMCMDFDSRDLNLGVIDLEEVRGISNADGKIEFRYGNPLYVYNCESNNHLAPAKIFPYINSKVLTGEKPTLLSDVYSVIGIAWNLCNGNYYMSKPNFSDTPPNIPEELTELLRKYATDTDSRINDRQAQRSIAKNILVHLNDIRLKVKRNEENYEDILIRFGVPVLDSTIPKKDDSDSSDKESDQWDVTDISHFSVEKDVNKNRQKRTGVHFIIATFVVISVLAFLIRLKIMPFKSNEIAEDSGGNEVIEQVESISQDEKLNENPEIFSPDVIISNTENNISNNVPDSNEQDLDNKLDNSLDETFEEADNDNIAVNTETFSMNSSSDKTPSHTDNISMTSTQDTQDDNVPSDANEPQDDNSEPASSETTHIEGNDDNTTMQPAQEMPISVEENRNQFIDEEITIPYEEINEREINSSNDKISGIEIGGGSTVITIS